MKRIQSLCLLFSAGLLLITSQTNAQVVGYQFGKPRTTGNEASVKASLVEPGLKASPLERGAGLEVNPEGGLVRSMVSVTKIGTTASLSDTSTAVAKEMYYKFGITVDKNYKASLSDLTYKIRASGGGAKVYYWKYSTDGKTFNQLGEPEKIVPAGAEGQAMTPVDLTKTKALQDIAPGTTVWFRLYTCGSNTTTGTTAIGRSAPGTSDDYAIAINGTVEKK